MEELKVDLCILLNGYHMSDWSYRDTKLHQGHITKSFSKPFRKKLEKDQKKKERQYIREAQRVKYDSTEEEDDIFYER